TVTDRRVRCGPGAAVFLLREPDAARRRSWFCQESQPLSSWPGVARAEQVESAPAATAELSVAGLSGCGPSRTIVQVTCPVVTSAMWTKQEWAAQLNGTSYVIVPLIWPGSAWPA